MKRLWSPWRMPYLENHESGTECVFCKLQTMPDGPENLIVWREEYAFVILNRYPYTSGHVMVVPFAHQSTLEALDVATRNQMMELATTCMSVLRQAYRPQAFNMGANIGAAAGAGIEEHVHIHIVPRWVGDTNFMSTVGQARVLPETLEDSYHRIKEAWENLKE